MQVLSWKRFARLGLLTAGLFMLAWSGGHAAQVQAAPNSAAPKGVAKIFGVDDGGVLSSNSTAAAQAAQTGAAQTRLEVSWANLEPTRGTYDFTGAEYSINRLLDAGLSPVVYISKNPAWAATTACGPINTKKNKDVKAFGKMVEALVGHFPDVKIWALYNEPDWAATPDPNIAGCFGSYQPGGLNNNDRSDSDEYAIMLATAWKAVHKANPNAKLAIGGLAYDNFDPTSAPPTYPGHGNGGKFNAHFLENIINYMTAHPLPAGQQYADMLLFNYYDIYSRYWQTQASGIGIQAKSTALRNKLKALQFPVLPLLVTETGEDSLSLGLQAQARCLDITMVRGISTKLKGIIWWTFKDFPDSNPPPSNTWKYGLVDENFQPKPSYTALSTLSVELNGFKYKKSFSGTPGLENVEAYQFKKGSTFKYVVWSGNTPTPQPPRLYDPPCSWNRSKQMASFTANKIRVVDYLGKIKTIKDNSKKDKNPAVGKIGFIVQDDPKLVQINP